MCNWKKKALVLALAGLALFSAAGCGGSADKKGARKGGEIVLYTSQPEADAQKLIAAFNQDHPDIKVKVFRSGTEEVVSKVLAEQTAGTVQADVLLVADNVTFEQLKQKDMLEKYASPELKGIPGSIHRQGPHLYRDESHHHWDHREYFQSQRRSQNLCRPGQT